MKPVYIAGAVGITIQEEYLRAVSQQRLIAEGRQNQVLRNLVYRLKQGGEWKAFTEFVSPLFALQGMDVPFDVAKDEWLTATYAEDGCQFDLVSAGSGFLQTINLLCFLFLNESRTALLDEPDSHMHDDLQRLVFEALDSLSGRRNLQLIIATHSPTMVDSAGLDSVLLVDRRKPKPLVAQDVDTLHLPGVSARRDSSRSTGFLEGSSGNVPFGDWRSSPWAHVDVTPAAGEAIQSESGNSRRSTAAIRFSKSRSHQEADWWERLEGIAAPTSIRWP